MATLEVQAFQYIYQEGGVFHLVFADGTGESYDGAEYDTKALAICYASSEMPVLWGVKNGDRMEIRATEDSAHPIFVIGE